MMFALAESDRQAQSRLAAFRAELQKLGWARITIDVRYAPSNDLETHRQNAKELVGLQPDLLIAQNSDATGALLDQTRTIPILFTVVADPISAGFGASFSRPGGNATGFITNEPTLGGKWLELLKEFAPSVTRVFIPYNVVPAAAQYYLNPLRATAALLGIEVSAAFFRDLSEFEGAVAAFASAPFGGLVLVPDAYLTAHRPEVISIVARHRLPTVYPFRFFADSGGLLSYGCDLPDNYRRAAVYADRILKGAKVSELPVQAPEKFELVINLKTAKALGLSIPPSQLARADEIIE